MKNLVFFIITALSLNISAQTEDYAGTYILHIDGKDGNILDYKLHLNSDNTFQFTSYQKLIDMRGEQNKYHYGKGTWKVENKIIKFTSTASDLDEKYTMDFTGSTARLIKKSARDTSDKLVPTTLQFYKSEIGIIEHLKLLLKE